MGFLLILTFHICQMKVKQKDTFLIKGNKIEAEIFHAKYMEIVNSIFEPTWISWVNPNTENPNFHTSTSFGVFKFSGMVKNYII